MSLMYGPDEDPIGEHYEHEGYHPGSACHQIMLADPQGGDIEPTEAMMAAHRQWAIHTFGIETWRSYSGEDREQADREPGQ